jgi:hypothetical protein
LICKRNKQPSWSRRQTEHNASICTQSFT